LSTRVSMKVQIPASYPQDAPIVIGGDVRVQDAHTKWQSRAYTMIALQTILDDLFYEFSKQENEEADVNTASNSKPNNDGKAGSQDQERSPKRTQKRAVQPKVKKSESENETEGDTTKKSRMRTVEEVAHRFIWEARVDRTKVKVGYEDRFRGVLEKPFDEFGFDVDVVDSDERVPLHRVVYFRYADRIVWDRRTRTDLVFGSTCEPGARRTTLSDLVALVEGERGRDDVPS
jgi:uncharacterized protein (UPF0248 family)